MVEFLLTLMNGLVWRRQWTKTENEMNFHILFNVLLLPSLFSQSSSLTFLKCNFGRHFLIWENTYSAFILVPTMVQKAYAMHGWFEAKP